MKTLKFAIALKDKLHYIVDVQYLWKVSIYEQVGSNLKMQMTNVDEKFHTTFTGTTLTLNCANFMEIGRRLRALL